MSNYTKATDFAAKDSLPSGDADKVVKGTEFETEFDAISTAIATKSDSATPTFTGDVTITSGSVILGSGEGIDFSATGDGSGTTSSEVLDDYEEGTFTPYLEGTSGTGTYGTAEGTYTKIGNICFFQAEIIMTSLGTLDGSLKLNGLPFSTDSADDGWSLSVGAGRNMDITAGMSLTGSVDQSSTRFYLSLWDLTTGSSQLLPADITSTFDFQCSGFYKVA